jgi:hypothetical protein
MNDPGLPVKAHELRQFFEWVAAQPDCSYLYLETISEDLLAPLRRILPDEPYPYSDGVVEELHRFLATLSAPCADDEDDELPDEGYVPVVRSEDARLSSRDESLEWVRTIAERAGPRESSASYWTLRHRHYLGYNPPRVYLIDHESTCHLLSKRGVDLRAVCGTGPSWFDDNGQGRLAEVTCRRCQRWIDRNRPLP